MALQSATINLSTASSNLQQYISDWESGYSAFNSGYFSPAFDPTDPAKEYDQWAAGNTGNSSSSAILTGDFTYATGGGFNGYVDTLTLGNSLTGSSSAGFGQTGGLDIVFDNNVTSSDLALTEAIYLLSNQGTLDNGSVPFPPFTFTGFNTYFDTYGTTVNGTGGGDTITAWAGADVINGGAGNDVINGAAGNDTITGGIGNDSLTGGIGNDTFLYAGGWGNDTITDFGSVSGNNDVIDLRGLSSMDKALVFLNTNLMSSGDLVISDGTNHITVDGVAGNQFLNLINSDNILI
ncbi:MULTISPECIES: calcium-binding protein [Bradyrhizobium]|uniref:calcium-binding protein n=1 Tax=Bradyrhizobium elkanii TaxID=29448 RepID=UPI00040826D5|nr:hypothetical protein [Bradyrhizobium elkanii]